MTTTSFRRAPQLSRRKAWVGVALVVAAGAGTAGPTAQAATKSSTGAPANSAVHKVQSLKTSAGPKSVVAAKLGAVAPSGSRVNGLVAAARAQIGQTTLYDPAYVGLAYPGGDVPIERGVCTDVVIRAYRAIGIDLQVVVHEDMVRRFSSYPRTALRKPDTNIDHRRVKNLVTFFTHSGAAVPATTNAADYLPGDIVMWDVGGLDHTGLVADIPAPGTDRLMVVHNIGDGAQMEDILFAFPIVGHFRYMGVPTTS